MQLKSYLLNIILITTLMSTPTKTRDFNIIIKPINRSVNKDMIKLGVTLGLIHGIASGYRAIKERQQEKVDNITPWLPITHLICYMNDSSYGYLCGSACGYTVGRLVSEWLTQ